MIYKNIAMVGLNKVFLIGHVGKTPELRVLKTGVAVMHCSLATGTRYQNKAGEWVEDTEWHRLLLWGELAQRAALFLKKGTCVHVEGHLKTRHYEDASGKKASVTEVVVDRFMVLDKPEV
jgi:single-strand DNA-binding protein